MVPGQMLLFSSPIAVAFGLEVRIPAPVWR